MLLNTVTGYDTFCTVNIASIEYKLKEEFDKHHKINESYLEQKIIPFRGHHLIGLKRDLLKHERTINKKYGKEHFLQEYKLFDLIIKDDSDISLKIIENEPDFICNLSCRQRQPSCFTGFNLNAKDYDRNIATKIGFEINKTYFANEVINKLKNSSIPWYDLHL